jgi:uncharacterized membrane protein SpoIIM required for sporulation
VKQQQFEQAGRPRWRELETLLERLEAGGRSEAPDFPFRYRRICQDLALARDRSFSRSLVEQLNDLALRGHRSLYRARRGSLRELGAFVARDFPRAVRAEWRLLFFVTLLFYGTAGVLASAVQFEPELVYSFLEPGNVAQLEQMYDPAGERVGVAPDAQEDVARFGYYIWNNVSIAFRTFAAGLLFGAGTLFIVTFNAIYLGLVLGHLTRIGFGEPIRTFVVAHGAFELTAILLCGVAGMRLGLSLLSPGGRSRRLALREDAQRALPLVYGSALMLLLAAGIEAFWSPLPLAAATKYGVGAVLWVLVLLYLGTAGRTRVF